MGVIQKGAYHDQLCKYWTEAVHDGCLRGCRVALIAKTRRLRSVIILGLLACLPWRDDA